MQVWQNGAGISSTCIIYQMYAAPTMISKINKTTINANPPP
ncbi:hypothetical protein B4064_3026 [Caldibacillus thermoamylovorans]|nr:hypothetical protein B4065_3265 [Caldibacillus thermoamylovorans]KIO63808.1 hypothetical protein B4064_3026 [Caldibacillus thermoamylovorans]